MFKRTLSLILAASFVFASLGVASALGDGNFRKGKYLFRKDCRSCHAPDKGAKVLEPLTYTQKEWEEAFKPEKIATYKCAEEFGKLSEKDLNDIYTYLWKHAKDSPTPAKCK